MEEEVPRYEKEEEEDTLHSSKRQRTEPDSFSLVEDFFLLGEFSYLSIADIAVVAKCCKRWNRGIGAVWKGKVEGGWDVLKPWLVSLGAPSNIGDEGGFADFVKNHLGVWNDLGHLSHLGHLRIDGVAASYTKICQVCNNDCQERITGFGFVAHRSCLSSFSKGPVKTRRIEHTSVLESKTVKEIGTSKSLPENTPASKVFARFKRLPRESVSSSSSKRSCIVSGLRSLIDTELTFDDIATSLDYEDARHERKSKVETAKLRAEMRKEEAENKKKYNAQQDRREAFLEWLTCEDLVVYAKLCPKQEEYAEFVEKQGVADFEFDTDDEKKYWWWHTDASNRIEEYLSLDSKASLTQVKDAVIKARAKDKAQLKMRRVLFDWLTSRQALRHLAPQIRWPLSMRLGGNGHCSRPASMEMRAIQTAVDYFMDYEVIDESAIKEAKVEILRVEKKVSAQFERQKNLREWMEAQKAHGVDLTRAMYLIEWPRKEAQQAPDHASEKSFARLPYHEPFFQDVVDMYLGFSVRRQGSSFSLDNKVTLEETCNKILEVQRCDEAQLQRMKELKEWVNANPELRRDYVNTIRWPQKLMVQEEVKEKGWWAPIRQRPLSHSWTEFRDAIDKYLSHSVDPAMYLNRVKQIINKVERRDRLHVPRQMKLQEWLRDPLRADVLVRDYMTSIEWRWEPAKSSSGVATWRLRYGDECWPYTRDMDAYAAFSAIHDYLGGWFDSTPKEVTGAIWQLNEIDKAQLARQEILKAWIQEEMTNNSVVRGHFEVVRWPWMNRSGGGYPWVYEGSHYNENYTYVYGNLEFGDYLSHKSDKEVITSLEAVKESIRAMQ